MLSQAYQFPCYALLCTVFIFSCKPSPKVIPPVEPANKGKPASSDARPAYHSSPVEPANKGKPASAWVQLASSKPPDRALALLALALTASPDHSEALGACQKILAETAWHIPLATLPHQLPVTQLEFSPPSSLWTSVASETNTATLRWNLETLEIEAILFPVSEVKPRFLVFDPSHRFMVIERGSRMLLCNAQSLKPIRELGPLDPQATPAAVIAFSADGLLLAHSQQTRSGDDTATWVLRESESGEIIRRFDPFPAGAPRPLSAHLNRANLQILRDDGSILSLPLSPVEQSRIILAEQAENLLPAQQRKLLKTQPSALLRTSSPLSAAAFPPDFAVLGEENGTVTVHRLLPLPAKFTSPDKPLAVDPEALEHFLNLIKALTGTRYDEGLQQFVQLTFQERSGAIAGCDFQAIRRIFPTLDFSPLLAAFPSAEPRRAAPEALLPLWNRMVEADSTRNSWFSILSFSRDLVATQWHKDLAAAVYGENSASPGATPWNAAVHLGEIFATGGHEQVLSAIHTAGPSGTAAASALALALESNSPQWIRACLARAANPPFLLVKLAKSRIAQLEGRITEALAGWPEPFPTVQDARTHEDWQGWEQADFSPALKKFRLAVLAELAAIQVPPAATEAQRRSVAAKLSNPDTLAIVGRARFAAACLSAAQAFSGSSTDSAFTVALASRARELGAAAVPCLRVEASALTALADFPNAHARWIELITEHPVAEHLPEDYSEAAYTAFENFKAEQAMEILVTGHRRFPNDANFALRAGWIALLTGTPGRAYQFLKAGQQLGYPAEKSEQAAALLTTAAVQAGALTEAALYLEDLVTIAPQWADPETVAAMNWPEEMKFAFSQLLSPQLPPMLDPQLMLDPLPEPLPSDP